MSGSRTVQGRIGSLRAIAAVNRWHLPSPFGQSRMAGIVLLEHWFMAAVRRRQYFSFWIFLVIAGGACLVVISSSCYRNNMKSCVVISSLLPKIVVLRHRMLAERALLSFAIHPALLVETADQNCSDWLIAKRPGNRSVALRLTAPHVVEGSRLT
jgi:hypothetical protein